MADIDRIVVLREQEAALVIHVLAVFQRLLRQGELQLPQLRYLVTDGVLELIEAEGLYR